MKGGGLAGLYEKAVAANHGSAALFAFGMQKMGAFSAVSLSVGMIAGTMGLPHLLIRFFTVPDAAVARSSLVIATVLIGVAMAAILLIVGPAAIAFVTHQPLFETPTGGIIGGSNLMTLHLSRALGGDLFFGIVSAVAFSTILAVVAGLNITISSAVSHDLLAVLWRGASLSERTELQLFRVAAFVTAAVAVALAIAFKSQNITFLVVMGTSMAASTTFPLLIAAIYWRPLTVQGVMACAFTGLVSTVGLIVLSPACWVEVLGHSTAIFPSNYPALIALPLTLAITWCVSMATRKRDIESTMQHQVATYGVVGAEGRTRK
jgi:cation/acetate symporter